ncbi:MAG: prepilin-type N-terminal cleavage/methylation domain-containing protein [Candidatus Pacebacteria bacterium]|nr:prepilin-type N-terminal cleavage/methylation domain-containing protein [Candidatus Paceibacterota bacterium]
MMKGFTLIETLVAISILAITMVAPFYAVEQSITAADASRDELIGSFLAQEGVEYVRGIRDDNYLYLRANPTSMRSWLYGVDGTTSNGVPSPNCFSPYVCTVDPTTSSSNQVQSYGSNATLPVLYLNTSYLYNQQNSGTATAFTRSVKLTTISSTEVKVVVTVSWTTRNIPYVTTITEYFDNWQT